MFSWGRAPTYSVPVVPQLSTADNSEENFDGYSVGVTNDGRTTLMMKFGYSTTTLTLTQDGVKQLIRLLNATIVNEEGANNEAA